MLRRGDVTRLRDAHWFKPAPEKHPELELCIVPSAGAVAIDGSGLLPEQHARMVCRDVFVDFKGYVGEDDQPVKNTADARLELWSMYPVQVAIRGEVMTLQSDAFMGEGSAASD